MKARWIITGLCSAPLLLSAGSLPVITTHPQHQVVAPGNDAILSLESTNATAYQWRFNGDDIPLGTNATLIVTNAQFTNIGYYMAVAKNEMGWTPSQLAYLSVVGNSVGFVPFANTNLPYSYQQVRYGLDCDHTLIGLPISNGAAQLVAGPVLDWMQPVGPPVLVTNGCYSSSGISVPTVSPGQLLYYRVDITYTCTNRYIPTPVTVWTTSTTLGMIAGGDGFPTPSADGIQFPTYLEWPDEVLIFPYDPYLQHPKVTGESTTLSVNVWAFGYAPRYQWRKDGKAITGYTTNRLLTITNLSASDAGVYDALTARMYGASPAVTPKFYLRVQTQNGEGVFRSPRTTGSDFIADFEGAAGRNYAIHWSTNLTDWSNQTTLTTTTGLAVFTNTITGNGPRYYRAMLLP